MSPQVVKIKRRKTVVKLIYPVVKWNPIIRMKWCKILVKVEAEKIKTPKANELRCNLRHDALLQDSSNADNENVSFVF